MPVKSESADPGGAGLCARNPPRKNVWGARPWRHASQRTKPSGLRGLEKGKRGAQACEGREQLGGGVRTRSALSTTVSRPRKYKTEWEESRVQHSAQDVA